jgi:hypothetical protein
VRQLIRARAQNQGGESRRVVVGAAIDDGRRTGLHFGRRESARRRSMKNVEMRVEGNTLVIRVDLTKDFGPSSSGKTTIIATTEGNVTIPDRDEKVGLNVYRKK